MRGDQPMAAGFEIPPGYIKEPTDERDFFAHFGGRVCAVGRFVPLAVGTLLFGVNTRHDDAYIPLDKEVVWKEESSGLVALIPGLHGTPHMFGDEIGMLKKRFSDADLVALHLPENGNVPLEESAARVEEVVKSYAKAHPDKPVTLIGESNGGRVAGHVEHALRDSVKKVQLVSLCGAFFGSRWMDFRAARGDTGSDHPAVVEGLKFGSEEGKALIKRMQEPLEEGVVRRHHFFASKDDMALDPYTTSHPLIEGAEHITITGASHWHLRADVIDQVVTRTRNFIDEPD